MKNLLDDLDILELAASLNINTTLKEHEVPLTMVYIDHQPLYDELRIHHITQQLEEQGIVVMNLNHVVEERSPIPIMNFIEPIPDIIIDTPKNNQPYFRKFEKNKFNGRK